MSMNNLEVTVATNEALDVRRFSRPGGMSQEFFTVALTALSRNPNIDFDAVVGKEASFTLQSSNGARTWHGLCTNLLQVGVEERACRPTS